jgi:hypothetical protein
MTNGEREIHRTGTCPRPVATLVLVGRVATGGIARHLKAGELSLTNRKPIPKNIGTRISSEVEKKVLHPP